MITATSKILDLLEPNTKAKNAVRAVWLRGFAADELKIEWRYVEHLILNDLAHFSRSFWMAQLHIGAVTCSKFDKWLLAAGLDWKKPNLEIGSEFLPLFHIERLQMNKVMVGLKCPKCQRAFFLPDLKSVIEANNTTMNCGHKDCNELILVREGTAYQFHQYMHQQDPRWPADGSRTGYVTIE